MIHARNYAGGVRGTDLIAFCDPSEECLNEAASEIEVPYVYKDYNEALKNPEIDAVIVVTPTRFRHDVVIAAAKAGKHVFCEKPMALDEKECDEMIEACRASTAATPASRRDASAPSGKWSPKSAPSSTRKPT